MTATTDRCPGCHGSGIEMSGVTYAGMSEYVGCHECGPECPDDCGCRVDAEPERPESIAPRHPGATQSPDGSQGATSWHEGSPYSCARPGCPAGCDRNDPTTEAPSDVRPSPPARDAVSMDSAVTDTRWSLLADKAALMGDVDRLTGERDRLRAGIEALMGDVDRLTAERDGARGMRVIATRAFETTRRVLQEASGLPDDIDDPDCRDEMVLALRPRAEKAEAEVARLVEEATVSAALLETEIAKREAAEMRANRATADLDALESEDRRQDVQAKHWREVLRIRRELDGIRQEMNDATEIIAKALGYRPSGLPLDGWPHLSTTGDHTPTSLAAEAAGVLAKASRLRAGIEALAAEMEADETPPDEERYVLDDYANALQALLAEGGE